MGIAINISLSVLLEIIFERSVLQWKIGMLMNTQKYMKHVEHFERFTNI